MTASPKIVAIGTAAPVDDVVAVCRQLLTLAEAGELRSILYIGQRRDGSRNTGFTESSDAFALLADVSRLVHYLNCSLDEGTRPVSWDDTPPDPAA